MKKIKDAARRKKPKPAKNNGRTPKSIWPEGHQIHLEALTSENAPRDIELLTRMGRFQLRNLAEKLRIFPPQPYVQEKIDFMALHTEDQARIVLERLRELDRPSQTGIVDKLLREVQKAFDYIGLPIEIKRKT